ncbi:MAG: Maf family protein [Reinekea sp.]|jgi:septum formation protein
MKLILASQSPRRRELLATLGVRFDTLSADIDETPLCDEQPVDYVRRLGLEKAAAGLALADNADAVWVLGSDTSVVADNRILGKPESRDEFGSMMSLLSGRTHQVMSSIALVSTAATFSEVVITEVRFTVLSDELIEHYWRSGEPHDKAGGYGIQGLGSVLVESILGSYSAVVGLPLFETARLLGKAGLPVWQGALVL